MFNQIIFKDAQFSSASAKLQQEHQKESTATKQSSINVLFSSKGKLHQLTYFIQQTAQCSVQLHIFQYNTHISHQPIIYICYNQ